MSENEINANTQDEMIEKEAEKQSENVTWAEYDAEELDSYPLEQLNLLELVNLRKEVKARLDEITTCRNMLNTVKDMITEQNLDKTAADTLNANYLEAYGFDEESTESFLKFAENTIPNIEKFVLRIEQRVDVLKQHGVSTKSLTEDMLTMIDKRMNKVSPENVNYKYVNKKFSKIRDAYETRLTGNMHEDYFGNKFTLFIRNKKLMREFKKDCKGNGKEFFNNLKRQYDIAVLHAAASVLIGKADKNDIVFPTYVESLCICIFYVLNRMLETEKKDNGHIYVDILFSDLMDMHNKTYDLGDAKDQMAVFLHQVSPATIVLADEMKKANPKISNSRIFYEFRNILDWKPVKVETTPAPVEEKKEEEPKLSAEEIAKEVLGVTPENPENIQTES